MSGGCQVIEFRGEAFGRSAQLKRVPRKSPVYAKRPVPQTDTGGWVEYTKAQE